MLLCSVVMNFVKGERVSSGLRFSTLRIQFEFQRGGGTLGPWCFIENLLTHANSSISLWFQGNKPVITLQLVLYCRGEMVDIHIFICWLYKRNEYVNSARDVFICFGYILHIPTRSQPIQHVT